jgi:hypothetical protein
MEIGCRLQGYGRVVSAASDYQTHSIVKHFIGLD